MERLGIVNKMVKNLSLNLYLIISLVLLSSCSEKLSVQRFKKAISINLNNDNAIEVSNLRIENLTNDSFTIITDFTGDNNTNSYANGFYCNETDNPGCDPFMDGIPVALVKTGSNYSININSLTTPWDPGDTISFEVKTNDADGGTGLSLMTSATLPSNELSIFNLQVNNITHNSFDIEIDYGADLNGNGSATLWYCNSTDTPMCDPLAGSSLLLTKGASSFTGNIVGLSSPNDPSDEITISIVATDADGTINSPATSTFNLAVLLATPIYRSVGPSNTVALSTGAGNNLTISNSIANFASSVDNDIGIGDILQYDSNNDGTVDTLAVIYGRVNSQSFSLRDLSGAVVTDLATADQDWSIFRAYTSLADAENGDENTGIDVALRNFDTWSGGKNLVASNEQWNMTLYADGQETNPVTFSGWTTSATNYLRVYPPNQSSEVGNSQRHGGIWNDRRFISNVDGNHNIEIGDIGNIVIEGLQIEVSPTGSSMSGINLPGNNDSEQHILKNNIIRASMSGFTGNGNGVRIALYNAPSTSNSLFLVNNIIYGFSSGNGILTINTDNSDNIYIYNNTVVGNSVGIDGRTYSGDNIELKNNISVNNQTDYNEGFDLALQNISSDGTSPNAGLQNKDIVFNHEEVWDFRLAGNSFFAIGTGQDLSADVNYAFNSDITNRIRTRWDIGASTAPRVLYRSIGPNTTTSLQVAGGNQLTVAINSEGHTQASFTNTILSNIGVGDVIQYDSTNDGTVDSIAFLSYRIDSNNYIVKNASGDNANLTTTQDQDWNIFRAYTSLFNVEAQIENTGIDASLRNFEPTTDLVTGFHQMSIALYNSGTAFSAGGTPDTTYVYWDAWQMDEQSFLKIYTPHLSTEVEDSQRHIGVFNPYMHHFSFTNGNGLFLHDTHTRLEGVQIEFNTNDANDIALRLTRHNPTVKNCIFKVDTAPVGTVVLSAQPGANISKIFNNIIIDNSNNTTAIDINVDPGYVYNNTIIGSLVGINAANNVTAKNNLVQNAGTGYSGTFQAASTNNLSNQADAPGVSPINSASVSFLDNTKGDFRLSSSDTVAKDSASSLASDVGLTFAYDIFNHSKIINSPDIGAHEVATQIYRSVGYSNSTALVTGAGNNLTITSGVANFASSTDRHVGVGDAIQYDSTNDGNIDSIVFIHERASNISYTVRNADGSIPTDLVTADQDWAIFRAYTSISNSIFQSENPGISANVRDFDNSASDKDLVSKGVQLNIALYADNVHSSEITITGFTTGPTRELNFFVPYKTSHVGVRQRHEGKWNDRFFNMNLTSGPSVINVFNDFTTIDGLQVNNTSDPASHAPIWVTSSHNNFINNILKDEVTSTDNRYGVRISDQSQGNNIIENNIIYDFNSTGASTSAILTYGRPLPTFISNNTVVSNIHGIYCPDSCLARNNIAYNNTTNDFSGGGFSADSDYNASSDATAMGFNSITSAAITFIDAANNDFRLSPDDTVAKNTGINLTSDYYASNVDHMEHDRGNSWDMGAHEAANRIYRSVGPGNTASLESGTGNNLTISSSVATFASAVADNIGVGDAIQYDSDNNGSIDSIMFIHGRNSSTQFIVADAEGDPISDMAVADQDWDIFRSYSGFNLWNGSENAGIDAAVSTFDNGTDFVNLKLRNKQLNVSIYADGSMDTLLVNLAWVTSDSNYAKIYAPKEASEVGVSQRHSGVWDDTKSRVIANAAPANVASLTYDNFNHYLIEGLQFSFENGSGNGLYITNNNPGETPGWVTIRDNIIRKIPSANADAISARHINHKLTITNNIMYGYSDCTYIRCDSFVGCEFNIYNNTCLSTNTGFEINDLRNSGKSTINLKNNILQNQTTDYAISNITTENYAANISSGATALGAGSLSGTTVTFVDSVNFDYRLATTEANAVNSGEDLSADVFYAFNKDIIGSTRAQWDIGAFAYFDFSTLTEFDAIGDGSSNSPYQLFSKEQLKDIGTDTINGCNSSTANACNAQFVFKDNIDINNEAYTPIGDNTNPFTGVIDGNDRTLDNLTINLPTTDNIGFVGETCAATLQDLTISNFSITGQNNVGVFVGRSDCATTTLSNLSSDKGTLIGVANTGGLVGSSASTNISNSNSRFLELTSSGNFAGGLLGSSDTASVTNISSSYSQGTIKPGGDEGGGIVGRFQGTGVINDSFSLIDIFNSNGGSNGGLVGRLADTTSVNRSWSGGDIVITSSSGVNGGFVGVVRDGAVVSDCFSLGRVEATQFSVGGFAGYCRGTITRSHSSGDVYSTNTYTGGFVGQSGGVCNISKSSSSGFVYGNTNVGGFIGLMQSGNHSDNYSTGTVRGNHFVGGFIGNMEQGAINRSYTTGDTNGIGTSNTVGGFVGQVDSTSIITNSYNRNDVSGDNIGGFAGNVISGTLTNNYSAAVLSSTTSEYSFINSITAATLNDNYWDSALSAVDGSSSAASSAGEYEGRTTSQLMDDANLDSGQSGFWDYTTDWTQLDGRDYPIHKTSAEGLCTDNLSATLYDDIGSGTYVDPYVICNKEQWSDFADSCDGAGTDSCDKIIHLGADINFNGEVIDHVARGFAQWVPFTGVFDGRNHTLSNGSVVGGESLFDHTSGALVKNLKIENVLLNEGLIGSADDSIFINISKKSPNPIVSIGCCDGAIVDSSNTPNDVAVIYGAKNISNILGSYEQAGIVRLASNTFIYKSGYYGEITGNGTFGLAGIISDGSYTSSVFKSKTLGQLLNTSYWSGGIVSRRANVYESYTSMDITGDGTDANFGAIAYEGRIENSYAFNSTLDAAGAGTPGGFYDSNQIEYPIKNSYSVAYFQNVTDAGGLSGNSSFSTQYHENVFWDSTTSGLTKGYESGNTSVVGSFEPKTSTELKQAATFSAWDTTNIWLIADTVREPRLRWDTHQVCQSNPTAITYNAIGSGSVDNPYRICYKEQLLDLSTNGCDSDSSAGCSSHYLLMNDIDLKGETWNTIGEVFGNSFSGTFNGNDKTISNLSSNLSMFDRFTGKIINLNLNLVNITPSRDRIGSLVGVMDAGIIDNVHITGKIMPVSGVATLGGLVGDMNAGRISNSSTNIDIGSSVFKSGGFVGEVDNGIIENSFANGSITSSNGAIGGFVGILNNTSLISNSYANVTMTFTGGNNIGGFVGEFNGTSTIQYSYALGNINHTTSGDNTGGFVGYLASGTINNCYSTGDVIGNYDTGGFIGEENGATVTVTNSYSKPSSIVSGGGGETHPFVGNVGPGTATYTNNYWDNTLVAGTDSAGEYEGLATADMDNSANFSGWNTTSVWRFPASGYPEIIPLSK